MIKPNLLGTNFQTTVGKNVNNNNTSNPKVSGQSEDNPEIVQNRRYDDSSSYYSAIFDLEMENGSYYVEAGFQKGTYDVTVRHNNRTICVTIDQTEYDKLMSEGADSSTFDPTSYLA